MKMFRFNAFLFLAFYGILSKKVLAFRAEIEKLSAQEMRGCV